MADKLLTGVIRIKSDIQKVMVFCACTSQFVSDLVQNSYERFSHYIFELRHEKTNILLMPKQWHSNCKADPLFSLV